MRYAPSRPNLLADSGERPVVDAAWITGFIRDLATGSPRPADVRADAQRYLSPSYIKRRHGVKSTFEDTIMHLCKDRQQIANIDVELLSLVIDEERRSFASRHVSYVKGKNGREIVVEIALFGSFDNQGRFLEVFEMARAL